MSWIKRHYKLSGVIATLVVLNAVLFFIGPEQIVESIGVKNTYLIVLVIAVVGGMSSFTGAAYVSAVIAFTAGGANPWLIGVCGGVGVFISDSIFYLLAEYGRRVVPIDWKPTLNRVAGKMQVFSTKTVLILSYIYHSLPLPSDLMMLVLVLGGYGFRIIAPVLFLAALTYSILLAHFGSLFF